MAPKKYTTEQMQSPYLYFVDIVADLPRYGIRAAPFICLHKMNNGNYEVQRNLPTNETVKVLNELELFYPPYGSKYTPAEAAEFINLVTANHPRLHAKATYTDYEHHLKWMKEHKSPVKKPAAKRAPAKTIAGKIQFQIGKTYFHRSHDDMGYVYTDTMKVVGRTPTMIEIESNSVDFSNAPSKTVRKRFRIHVSRDGEEFIMPQQYSGAAVWHASDVRR